MLEKRCTQTVYVTCTERIGRIEVECKAVRDFHRRRNLGAIAEGGIHLITGNILHRPIMC